MSIQFIFNAIVSQKQTKNDKPVKIFKNVELVKTECSKKLQLLCGLQNICL